MKKILTLCAMMAMFLGLSIKAYAQDPNAQAEIIRQINRIALELGLDGDLEDELHRIISARRRKVFEFLKAARKEEQIKSEMRKIIESQLESLKAISTLDQVEKYIAIQKRELGRD